MDFGPLSYLIPVSAVASLATAGYLSSLIGSKDPGNAKMQSISEAINVGAYAYLRRQYKGVVFFFVAMFAVLLVLASAGHVSFFTPFACLSGGFFSGLAGYIGMVTAT